MESLNQVHIHYRIMSIVHPLSWYHWLHFCDWPMSAIAVLVEDFIGGRLTNGCDKLNQLSDGNGRQAEPET